jgi:hypothetical protein
MKYRRNRRRRENGENLNGVITSAWRMKIVKKREAGVKQ